MNSRISDASKIRKLGDTKEYTNIATGLLSALLSSNLSPQEKNTWVLLYNLAKCNEELKVTIRLTNLAGRLARSPRSVSRYIKKLIVSGFLETETNYADSGGQTSNTYYVRIPKLLLVGLAQAPDRGSSTKTLPENYCRTKRKSVLKSTEPKDLTENFVSAIKNGGASEPSSKGLSKFCKKTNLVHKSSQAGGDDSISTTQVLCDPPDNSDRGGHDTTDVPNSTKYIINTNNNVVVSAIAEKTPELNSGAIQAQKQEIEASALELRKQLASGAHNSAQRLELYQEISRIEAKANFLENKLNKAKPKPELAAQSVVQSREVLPQYYSYLVDKLKHLKQNVESLVKIRDEILYEVTQGSLTKSSTNGQPISVPHAINIALKLVKEGRWSTPSALVDWSKELPGKDRQRQSDINITPKFFSSVSCETGLYGGILTQ